MFLKVYGLGFFYRNILKKLLGINHFEFLAYYNLKLDYLMEEELFLNINIKKNLSIKELIALRTLNGIEPWSLRRKNLGLPCRGQRTKTNASISKSKFKKAKPITFKQTIGEKKKNFTNSKAKNKFKSFKKKTLKKKFGFKKRNWFKRKF